jgi:hypothetical protein
MMGEATLYIFLLHFDFGLLPSMKPYELGSWAVNWSSTSYPLQFMISSVDYQKKEAQEKSLRLSVHSL